MEIANWYNLPQDKTNKDTFAIIKPWAFEVSRVILLYYKAEILEEMLNFVLIFLILSIKHNFNWFCSFQETASGFMFDIINVESSIKLEFVFYYVTDRYNLSIILECYHEEFVILLKSKNLQNR